MALSVTENISIESSLELNKIKELHFKISVKYWLLLQDSVCEKAALTAVCTVLGCQGKCDNMWVSCADVWREGNWFRADLQVTLLLLMAQGMMGNP